MRRFLISAQAILHFSPCRGERREDGESLSERRFGLFAVALRNLLQTIVVQIAQGAGEGGVDGMIQCKNQFVNRRLGLGDGLGTGEMVAIAEMSDGVVQVVDGHLIQHVYNLDGMGGENPAVSVIPMCLLY